MRKWAVGSSKEERREQNLEARERGEAMQRQILAQRELQQKNIKANQEHAMEVLKTARKLAAERQKTFDTSAEKYRDTSNKLLESSKSLDNANNLLNQLGAEKIDLVRSPSHTAIILKHTDSFSQAKTRQIIEQSMESLTKFRQQIDTMLAFFRENAEYVESLTSPRGQLGKTLAAIEGISQASGNEEKARIIKELQVDPGNRKVCR